MLDSHVRLSLPNGHFLRGVSPKIIVASMNEDPVLYLTVVQEGNWFKIMREIIRSGYEASRCFCEHNLLKMEEQTSTAYLITWERPVSRYAQELVWRHESQGVWTDTLQQQFN